MNKLWIKDSHSSARLFKNNPNEYDAAMRPISTLDMTGMFETSWMIFNHSNNTKYGYGYPK